MAPKSKSIGSSSQPKPKDKTQGNEFRRFTMEEVNKMTSNLRNLCGEGQFAKVYSGQLYGEDIAVKAYPTQTKDMAMNEIAALSDLMSFPHIIPLKGICMHEGQSHIYIVMKFVPQNLEQLLEGHELKWSETLKILRQLALSLEAVDKQGYVIGDLKPDNVLIDQSYNVYLCDFGSAKKGGEGIPTRNKLYTPKELCFADKGTSKSDIYSYGCILLQMVMNYNDFMEKDHSLGGLQKELNRVVSAASGKKNKAAPNSSRRESHPHVTVQARCSLMRRAHGHVVHKRFMQSGCDDKDADLITKLGIDCTHDEIHKRPSIKEVVSTIKHMKY